MDTRQCNGTTKGGAACKRPPSKDRPYCLAHDPERVDKHAALSKHGGHMRHDTEALSIKDEVRVLIADVRSGAVSPGAGNVMATLYRLLREITAEEARHEADNAPDSLIESIQSMREAGNVPDLSEPANGGGGESWPVDTLPVDTPKPYDPDAPRIEDYKRPDGTLDGDGYLTDLRAHKVVPLSHLSIEQRRKRFASSRRV
jgi:hypothetical protein